MTPKGYGVASRPSVPDSAALTVFFLRLVRKILYFQGVNIVFDFSKFEKVLTCDGQTDDPVTPSNNLVDIFEAAQASILHYP